MGSVWVVLETWDHEGSHLYGVFSSKGKAEEYVTIRGMKGRPNLSVVEITEMGIDVELARLKAKES